MNEQKTCTCPVCNSEVSPADGISGEEKIIQGIIEFYKEMQEQKEYLHCPRCGQENMTERNAVSRQFDIEVCSACGTQEAVMAVKGEVLASVDWWVVKWFMSFREFRH